MLIPVCAFTNASSCNKYFVAGRFIFLEIEQEENNMVAKTIAERINFFMGSKYK